MFLVLRRLLLLLLLLLLFRQPHSLLVSVADVCMCVYVCVVCASLWGRGGGQQLQDEFLGMEHLARSSQQRDRFFSPAISLAPRPRSWDIPPDCVAWERGYPAMYEAG